MIAFVTGVGSGIGKATCIQFLKHSHTVIGVLRKDSQAIQLSQEAENLPGNLHLINIDLNDTSLFSKIHSQLQSWNIQSIDALINIAGVLGSVDFEHISLPSINKVMHVNFIVPTLMMQELLPQLKCSSRANIVNVTSMSGYQNSVRFPGLSIYGASKAALASVTQSLAVELQPFNIHCNALAIGAVNTDMLQAAFPDFQAQVSPTEMASFVYSFATEGYKVYNGQVLPVAITNP